MSEARISEDVHHRRGVGCRLLVVIIEIVVGLRGLRRRWVVPDVASGDDRFCGLRCIAREEGLTAGERVRVPVWKFLRELLLIRRLLREK